MIEQLIILQACGLDPWLNGKWDSCVVDPVQDLIGAGLFGLTIGATVYTMLYFAAGGRSATATVVTILVASVLFPVLPGQYRGIAWAVLLVGGAAAIFQAFQKYMLNPGTMQ